MYNHHGRPQMTSSRDCLLCVSMIAIQLYVHPQSILHSAPWVLSSVAHIPAALLLWPDCTLRHASTTYALLFSATPYVGTHNGSVTQSIAIPLPTIP